MKLDQENKLKLIFIRDILEEHVQRMGKISFELHKAIRGNEISESLLDSTRLAYEAYKAINKFYEGEKL